MDLLLPLVVILLVISIYLCINDKKEGQRIILGPDTSTSYSSEQKEGLQTSSKKHRKCMQDNNYSFDKVGLIEHCDHGIVPNGFRIGAKTNAMSEGL